MPEWTQRLKKPAGALPPNMMRNAGVVFFVLVMGGLVLSTLWSGSTDDAGDALAGSEPNLTNAGHVAQLTSRLTDLQSEQQRRRAREAEQAQRDAEAAQALAGLFGLRQGGTSGDAAGVGGTLPDLDPHIPDSEIGGGGGRAPGAILTPDEIELRERLRLEGLERRGAFVANTVNGADIPTAARGGGDRAGGGGGANGRARRTSGCTPV